MKPQDILLLVILLFFLWKNNKNWTTIAGIILILLSIPLFYKHVFFTAERLTWYGGLFFLVAVIQTVVMVKIPRR